MPIPALGVNIDHVATVRQARWGAEPEPATAAALAVLGGAEVITCHLREDRRHINDRDLALLRQTLTCKLNLEMAATSEMAGIALRTRPEQVTLVPEKRAELTTEGGLNVAAGGRRLAKIVGDLQRRGILVSLFIDAAPEQIAAAARIGAEAVELHTGPYANARTKKTARRELVTLLRAAEETRRRKLLLNAGHGLNYLNIRGLLETVDGIAELHIGHSIVSRAVLVGFQTAVREMCDLIARHSKK